MTTALLTDHYELTMLQAALADGTAHRRAVFDLFARHLPPGRRYGVVAGTGRAIAAVKAFRFGDAELEFLRTEGIVDPPTLDWLADFAFSGEISGYAEGEIYFPHSPVAVVESSFAEGVLLETVLTSIYNHDSAVASAASRMTLAAGDRPCIEMGSRRTHEEAAVAVARAAYIAGFAASSNLEARRRHGVPSTGTSAHSFTLLHDAEADAFASQVASLGAQTTLLVDTYDVPAAVREAVAVAGPRLGAVRIDSGDLGVAAQSTRALLDELGAVETKIVVTSDLDEHAIAALASAPVDAYGVGTQVATGAGHPTCGFVYKLVAREDAAGQLAPVAKTSPGKASRGGRKIAFRERGPDGRAAAEIIEFADPAAGPGSSSTARRALITPLIRQGEPVAAGDLESARRHHAAARGELPLNALRLQRGEPALETRFTER